MSLPKITTFQEQLDHWVEGVSLHLGVRGRLSRDDDSQELNSCTPDFSCCEPRLQWDEPTRRAFYNGGEGVRNEMLINSLGSALALMGQDHPEQKVHVVGTPVDATLQ